MPRQKNTKPTSIYWLVDTRTNTPFYCGKSVRPGARFREHKRSALADGKLPVHAAVRDCFSHVGIVILESNIDAWSWVDREKYWIAELRKLNPNCTNISEGGAGVAGLIRTAEHRAKIGAAVRARSQDPAYRARLSAAHKGRSLSPEHRDLATAQLRALTSSPAYQIGNSQRTKKRWQDPVYRARMTALATGKTLSADARKKISESKKNLSAETRAKLSAAAQKRWAAHHA